MEHVEALFGDHRDAYNILKQPDGMRTSSTTLDPNDTALILTEEDGLQLFLPANGKLNDRALALVEIYNAMCNDKGGKDPLYKGFTQPFIDRMKSRV
jgi:hypothetical protein